jgi:mono/diheme cytochrome c family protein
MRLTALLIPLFLISCGYRGNKSGIHWFLDLQDHPGVEAQEEDLTTLDLKWNGTPFNASGSMTGFNGVGSAMRVPPEGSVARNQELFEYAQAEGALAGEEMKNPLLKTQAVLERGKKQYEIYCTPCHGFTGKGDGMVTPMFTPPPSLLTGPAAKTWKDGEYYHMITMGRVRMKSYAAQIQPVDRWAIIHYVRLLQATQK